MTARKRVIRDRLTRSALLHLLHHDSKHSKYFDHHLDDDVLDCLQLRRLGILLEPSEEILNALEGCKDRILARNDVLSRLCGFGIRKSQHGKIEENSYRKEDTDTSENEIGRWEILEI